MPQLNIYIDSEEDGILEKYMAKHKISSKLEAIRKILRELNK